MLILFISVFFRNLLLNEETYVKAISYSDWLFSVNRVFMIFWDCLADCQGEL